MKSNFCSDIHFHSYSYSKFIEKKKNLSFFVGYVVLFLKITSHAVDLPKSLCNDWFYPVLHPLFPPLDDCTHLSMAYANLDIELENLLFENGTSSTSEGCQN